MAGAARRRQVRDASKPNQRYFVDAFIPYLLNQVTNTLNQRFKRALKPFGLSISQWRVLAILNTDDSFSLMQVAAMSAIDQPTLSRIIDQMVEQGLATREPRAEDGRFVSIALSAAGRRCFEAVWPVAEEHGRSALQNLSRDDEATLRRILKGVLETLSKSPI